MKLFTLLLICGFSFGLALRAEEPPAAVQKSESLKERIAQIEAKLKEFRERASEDPAIVAKVAALEDLQGKMKEAEEVAIAKLDTDGKYTDALARFDVANNEERVAIKEELKGLKEKIGADPDLQAASKAFGTAKKELRAAKDEAMEKLDPEVLTLQSQLKDLQAQLESETPK